MTNDETILFIQFLKDKGMLQNYEYFYLNHRLDKRTLEAFMEQTDARDVILHAFDIGAAPNSIFNVKYWQQLNAKWTKKLEEFTGNDKTIPGDPLRCEHCGRALPRSSFAVGKKGQLHKYCMECESGEWDRKRKEKEAADKEREKQEKAMRQLEKEIAEKRAKLERISTACPAPVKPDRLTAPKLDEYHATMHYKKAQKSITLNAVLSEQIRQGEFTKCFLNSDRQHRMFLLFNRSDGANITGASSMAQSLLNVNSADMVRALAARFNLEEGDNYYLRITRNLSRVDNLLNVEVLGVQSREEYARIAQCNAGNGKPVDDGTEDTDCGTALAMTDEDEQAHVDEPMLDFVIEEEPKHIAVTPDAVLQAAIDRGVLTERDIAAFLYNKGWKLQQPVITTTHKKFSI